MRHCIKYRKFMQWKFYATVKKEAAAIYTTKYCRAVTLTRSSAVNTDINIESKKHYAEKK